MIDKAVTFDDFIFPLREEEWQQPLDARKMTRRIIKKGELIVGADMCIGNTMPIDPDEVDDADEETRKLRVIRKKIKSISPAASSKGSPATSDVEQESKKEASGEGGQVSDADTEASEETKFLPDK